MACAFHGDELPALPHHRKARPSPSGYAQNRHETPTMLRNHHANPPTRTPITARMCMPSPGLVNSACEFARNKQGDLSPKRTTL